MFIGGMLFGGLISSFLFCVFAAATDSEEKAYKAKHMKGGNDHG